MARIDNQLSTHEDRVVPGQRMTYLLRPFVLCFRYWPQLTACYLLGLLGRRGAIELAAWAGWDNDAWASLIMPLAGMARLGSYVAMFFVLRQALPALAALPSRSLRSVDVFSTVIVPFFAIYLAWKLFAEDWIAFEAAALDYRIGDAMMTPGEVELHPETLPVSNLTWALIFAALVARYVLSRFKELLPGWMIAVRVYVDALWVFLGVSFAASKDLTFVLNPTGWLSERRIVVWFNDTRADLFSHFRPLEVWWDTVTWAVSTVFGGATIPLLWLAVAAIVYGVTMPDDWRGAARRVAGQRADWVLERAAARQKRVRERWSQLPDVRRDEARDWFLSRLGNYRNITDAARLILHGGQLLPPRGPDRVSLPRHGVAYRASPEAVLGLGATGSGFRLAPDHRAAAGMPDRLHCGVLRRTCSPEGSYSSKRTVISSLWVMSSAVGTASDGTTKANWIRPGS